jgi:hypothetical protein
VHHIRFNQLFTWQVQIDVELVFFRTKSLKNNLNKKIKKMLKKNNNVINSYCCYILFLSLKNNPRNEKSNKRFELIFFMPIFQTSPKIVKHGKSS